MFSTHCVHAIYIYYICRMYTKHIVRDRRFFFSRIHLVLHVSQCMMIWYTTTTYFIYTNTSIESTAAEQTTVDRQPSTNNSNNIHIFISHLFCIYVTWLWLLLLSLFLRTYIYEHMSIFSWVSHIYYYFSVPSYLFYYFRVLSAFWTLVPALSCVCIIFYLVCASLFETNRRYRPKGDFSIAYV